MKDDMGSYEFKKQYMNDEPEPEPKGGCLAMSALFAMVMLGLMCWGFWMLAN